MNHVSFSNLFDFQKKSKIKAGDGLPLNEGSYPFYTSSKFLKKSINEFLFDGNSLIFGTGGSASVHYCNERFAVSTDCFVTQPKNNDELFLKYIYYFLSGNIQILENGFKGAGLKHISKGYISDIKIPLPHLDQQKKIAAILDAADAYRQKTKALITKYDELTKSLFLDMFGDPVTNPKGWDKNILKSHLIDVKNGITRRPKTEEDKSGQIVLKLKHIRSNFINYDCDNRILLENSEKTKFSVNIGDLLFIRVNGNPDYVGRCALHDNNKYEVFFNDHIMRVRVDLNTFNSLFLCQYLNYPYGQREISKRVKTSAGQHTINQGGLDKLNLIVPPLELQNQFAERVQAIESQKTQAQASLAQSEDLFNSLLQRAFKGKLTS
jgi:type I restriction enzyme S subunit